MLIFAPNTLRLHLELGVVYYRLGAYDVTRTYFEQALAKSERAALRRQQWCQYGLPGRPGRRLCGELQRACLRDELLDGKIFYTLREVQIVIESWRRHYNAVRPHVSLG